MMKKKAKLTIKKGNYAPSHKNGAEYISVDFEGHNEGSCGGHDTPQEAEEQVQYLLKKHSQEYEIEIIDKRIKQQTLF